MQLDAKLVASYTVYIASLNNKTICMYTINDEAGCEALCVVYCIYQYIIITHIAIVIFLKPRCKEQSIWSGSLTMVFSLAMIQWTFNVIDVIDLWSLHVIPNDAILLVFWLAHFYAILL